MTHIFVHIYEKNFGNNYTTLALEIEQYQSQTTLNEIVEKIGQKINEITITLLQKPENFHVYPYPSDKGLPLNNLQISLEDYQFLSQDLYLIITDKKNISKPLSAKNDTEKIEKSALNYTSISKYTFYEYDEWTVKVILELKGIGKIPKENIQSRFFDKSFEVKIHDYQTKNWLFAVAQLHYKADPSGCKVMIKEDKLIITIKKSKKERVWWTLHKTQTVGKDDSD